MAWSRGLKVYQRLVQERPYTVQTIQTVSLMSIGDGISQYMTETELNGYRMMKFGSIGLVVGPALTKWYHLLDKIKSSSMKIAFAKKLALDQLIFAPIVMFSIVTVVALIDGKTRNEIKNKLEQDYFHIMATNYKVWPFVQSINFTLIPLNYRVLVTQSVAVGWNTYLSWKLNSDST